MLISCGESKTKPENENNDDSIINLTEAQFKKGNLKLGKPEMISFSEVIEVTGMVDVPPRKRSTVSSFFEGYVTKTDLLIGDQVNKGDLLIQLKNPDFVMTQQNYAEALSDLEYFKSEFDRKKALYEEKVIAQKVFQAIKNKYLNAKAKLSSAEEQIKLMNLNPQEVSKGNFTSEISIYAPLSGKISKMNVSQGMYISKSAMIMEILDVDHIHLELDVFEKDLFKIQKGDSLEFEIPEISEQKYNAYVRLVGAEIDQNRKVRIHAHPVDENTNFTVGMFVNAFFKYESKEQVALPEGAFTEIDDRTYILELLEQTDNSYKFKKIEVESSSPQDGFKPILNPSIIDSKSEFLTKGVFDIVTMTN